MHNLEHPGLSYYGRKEQTMPFGVNLMRSQALYRAAQVLVMEL